MSRGRSKPTFENCIIWGNTADSYGNEMHIYRWNEAISGIVTLKNCCIKTEFNDIDDVHDKQMLIDCIHKAPLFEKGILGEFYLKDNSPCIGAGSGTVEKFDFLDIKKHTTSCRKSRYSSSRKKVDIGFHYKR